MHKSMFSLAVVAPLACGCASVPPPTQRMADAVAAERSAGELGANSDPGAQLSMKLAEEQIAQGKKAMTDGDNKAATGLFVRAKADAELAIAQARENGARVDVQRASEASSAQKATNIGQGASK
jgi:hypothetical protein